MKLTRTAHRVVPAAVVITLLMFAACASDDGDSVAREQLQQEKIQLERREAARLARQDERLQRLENELRDDSRTQPAPASPPTETAVPPSTVTGEGSSDRDTSESWPSGTNAWTVMLTSATSHADAEAIARQASTAGLPQVGLLLSDNHSSLHRGYWVAYTGVLDRSEADQRANDAHAVGFADAYARFVSAR